MKNAAVLPAPELKQTPENIVMRHLDSFCQGDLDAVMADYTDSSVFITQDATYKGPEAIKNFFVALLAHFPKQQPGFELDMIAANNELVLIVWHATTPSLHVPFGTDTFIVRQGKIHLQTFAGCLHFSDAPSLQKMIQ